MSDIEELKQAVKDKTDGKTSVGKTNVRLDASCVNDVKQELGVSQNTQVAPFIESVIYKSIGEDEKAEERRESFKEQFEEE